jgi:hypothetical protein
MFTIRRCAVLFAFIAGAMATLAAQTGGPCPTANSTNQSISLSGNLVCTVPQVYGPGGLVGTPNNGPLVSTANFSHAAHFQNASVAGLGPLNSEIGAQISQLPLTAPAAGFIFSFNPSLGVVSRETQNFGPILSDRAETIGRHKLFLGLSYQYFNFDKIGSVNLRRFGAVYHHEAEDCSKVPPTFTGCPASASPSNPPAPVFENDFISATNGIGLTVNQVTLVATFGLTNRLDVGLAIPILSVNMSASSDATINWYESATTIPSCCLHAFDPAGVQPGETLYAADPTYGFHNHAAFLRKNSAHGIGDIVVRAKYQAIKRERAGLAAGVDVHAPTGDEYNFLGSGTWGTRPFLTFSYGGRVAPHANIGYQINGNSILGGDITSFVKAHLPNILNYSAGLDAGIARRLSLSFDYLGQTLFSEQSIVASTFTAVAPCNVCGTPLTTSASNITAIRTNINQSSVSLGAKINPFGRLLVIANVLIRVNDAGLHYKPAPMIGLSYTF